jgi:hypothetical protein
MPPRKIEMKKMKINVAIPPGNEKTKKIYIFEF